MTDHILPMVNKYYSNSMSFEAQGTAGISPVTARLTTISGPFENARRLPEGADESHASRKPVAMTKI
jgi:hypothetical protein